MLEAVEMPSSLYDAPVLRKLIELFLCESPAIHLQGTVEHVEGAMWRSEESVIKVLA